MNPERAFEIKVYATELSDAQFDALFDRVAEAAHLLDESVTCSAQEVDI